MTDTDWRAFTLTPDDVLFFRDGKPSTRGSDHYLRSVFPPHPSTLYGALRTRRLLDSRVSLDGLEQPVWTERLGTLVDELGEWAAFGSLELRGPWLVRGKEVLLPAPADLAVLLREERGAPPVVDVALRYRVDESASPATWSHPLGAMIPHERAGGAWRPWQARHGDEREPASAADYYLKPRGVTAWMRGGLPAPEDFVRRDELWLDEMRTGVGLQAEERSSEAGQIYTFGYIRLVPGVTLGFEARGTALAADGRVRLGGDARTAQLGVGPGLGLVAPALDGTRRVCLSFATPTLSAAGACPPGFDTSGHGRIGGHAFRLVGAVVEHFVLAGGWNVALGRPKPLRRAIPSGSVFIVEPMLPGDDGQAALAALNKLHAGGLADFSDEQLARQGFGLTLVGAY